MLQKNTRKCNKLSKHHLSTLNKHFNNNKKLTAGPSFSGKTHLMLKILSRIPDRENYIINQSPSEQFSNSKSKIKEIGEEINRLDENKNDSF